MWNKIIERLFNNKPSKIPLYVEEVPAPAELPKTTMRDELLKMVQECDLDTLVKSPTVQMAMLPLYCASIDNLMQEVLAPSRIRSLVGVTVHHYFKESNLPPSLALERLAGLFTTEPDSNFARYDVATLISEFRLLAKM